MKAVQTLIVIAVVSLLLGCDNGGGGSNPCDDVCDEIKSCDFEGYDNDDCDDFCEEVDDIQDDASNRCRDAIDNVLDCAAEASCDELESTLELEPEDVLEFEFERCEAELAVLLAACGDE